MECRRKVILKHFGEDATNSIAQGKCCDVCEMAKEVCDRQAEILAILKAVREIPGYGESKVCSHSIYKYSMLFKYLISCM